MKDNASVSVVIRCFNEEKFIGRLLTGVLEQSIKNTEIILVDSGSTDATLSIASQYPVQIIHINPEQFSFGRSLNLGCQAAQNDLIAIASAHVYPVYPDWLERLITPFCDPQVALTYGKQRGNENTKFSEQQIFAHWFPDHAPQPQAHPFCNNANAAIRRSLWEKHPYDETLSGLEDLEWAHWAMSSGYKIKYVPEAEIIHVHNETPAVIYNRYRREAIAFKRIFPEEKFRLVDFIRLVYINILSDIKQARKQKVLSKNLASICWFRWMQFWGTYQGYRQAGPLSWQLRRTFYYPTEFTPAPPENSRRVEPIRYDDKLP